MSHLSVKAALVLVVLAPVATCGGDGSSGTSDTTTVVTSSATFTSVTVGETDPVDTDQDTRTADNCPGLFNPDQTDTDGDGIGDRCDEKTEIPEQCGVGAEVEGVVGSTLGRGGGGDTEHETVCISTDALVRIIEGLGYDPTIVLEIDQALILDLEAGGSAVLAEAGFDLEPIDELPGVTPARLIEERIRAAPSRALDSATVEHLPDVDPDVFTLVPDDALEQQSAETLAAIPSSFWKIARPSAVEAIGRERLEAIGGDAARRVTARTDVARDPKAAETERTSPTTAAGGGR